MNVPSSALLKTIHQSLPSVSISWCVAQPLDLALEEDNECCQQKGVGVGWGLSAKSEDHDVIGRNQLGCGKKTRQVVLGALRK